MQLQWTSTTRLPSTTKHTTNVQYTFSVVHSSCTFFCITTVIQWCVHTMCTTFWWNWAVFSSVFVGQTLPLCFLTHRVTRQLVTQASGCLTYFSNWPSWVLTRILEVIKSMCLQKFHLYNGMILKETIPVVSQALIWPAQLSDLFKFQSVHA